MISEVYAMAPPPRQEGQPAPSIFQSFVFPLVVIFGILYFLIIRPQKKREQKQKQFIDALKKGDEVVTQSGIYGKVTGVADQVVTLEIAEKTKIKIAKSFIAGYQSAQTQPEANK